MIKMDETKEIGKDMNWLFLGNGYDIFSARKINGKDIPDVLKDGSGLVLLKGKIKVAVSRERYSRKEFFSQLNGRNIIFRKTGLSRVKDRLEIVDLQPPFLYCCRLDTQDNINTITVECGSLVSNDVSDSILAYSLVPPKRSKNGSSSLEIFLHGDDAQIFQMQLARTEAELKRCTARYIALELNSKLGSYPAKPFRLYPYFLVGAPYKLDFDTLSDSRAHIQFDRPFALSKLTDLLGHDIFSDATAYVEHNGQIVELTCYKGDNSLTSRFTPQGMPISWRKRYTNDSIHGPESALEVKVFEVGYSHHSDFDLCQFLKKLELSYTSK